MWFLQDVLTNVLQAEYLFHQKKRIITVAALKYGKLERSRSYGKFKS